MSEELSERIKQAQGTERIVLFEELCKRIGMAAALRAISGLDLTEASDPSGELAAAKVKSLDHGMLWYLSVLELSARNVQPSSREEEDRREKFLGIARAIGSLGAARDLIKQRCGQYFLSDEPESPYQR